MKNKDNKHIWISLVVYAALFGIGECLTYLAYGPPKTLRETVANAMLASTFGCLLIALQITLSRLSPKRKNPNHGVLEGVWWCAALASFLYFHHVWNFWTPTN